MKKPAALPPEVTAAVLVVLDFIRQPAPPRVADVDPWVDAKSSGLGVRTFRRAAREGAFAVHLVGKRWVARRSAVDAWIESQRVDFTKREPGEGTNALDAAIASGRLRVVGRGGAR